MIIELRPIGFIITRYSDDQIRSSWEGVEGYIEIFEQYVAGLRGIEDFSHIIVIAYLHKVTEHQRKTLIVKPRRAVRLGFSLEDLPEIGVFASDSPHRPNPIALSILELIKVDRNILYVKNLDLFDGTPVLDIKPYTPSRRIDNVRIPSWVKLIEERIRDYKQINSATHNK
ncbi:MAG: tRNA (N6-threonylcarbamoyladenosine(37)-N6)-methyltransferase TrmO [Sulfolobales archaeon]